MLSVLSVCAALLIQPSSHCDRRSALLGGGATRSRELAPMRPLVHVRHRAPLLLAGPPSTSNMIRFALPALGSWLVSPLMSLVDTAVVGRSASSLELAALGPATMVGDSLSYLFSFLSVATTNLIATSLASEDAGGDDAVREILATAVRLALLCGVASCAAQLCFGRTVLARYTGGRSAACVAPAFEYVRVRALGAPAALLTKVSIAACLATRDSVTPLVVVAAGGALNLGLDVLLVSVLGYGISGAAWATFASEVACAAAALLAVTRKLGPRAAAARRALLPTRAQLTEYAAFARPLLLTLAGKIATYSSLAHVATTVGVASTAAHRVLMGIYWFTWPFAETLSQTGQTFLPEAIVVGGVRPLVRRLLAGGAIVGAASAAASGALLTFAPHFFTADAAVVACVRSLLPLVCGCIATLATMCALEGTLLATRDLTFLSTFYSVNAVAMVAAFQAVERIFGGGLKAAWGCMLAFQLGRLAAFGLRLRGARGSEVVTKS